VNAAVDFPEMQYAVIKGLQTEPGREHMVIAYPNEKSLRDLFAAPSILALGFATRDEAVVAGRASFPTLVADQRRAGTRATADTNRSRQGLSWGVPRKETGSVLRTLGRLLASSYSDIVVSAIVILSSSSSVSAAIRMALGSSV
jgi:hypothetical protein